MNNIIRYNTFILNFVLVVFLLILIAIVSYKLWQKHVGKKLRFKLGVSEKEDFSQVTLEKQVKLYDDYRNYVEGKNLLTKRCSTNKRMLPYIVSPSCFTDKYVNCMKDKVTDSETSSGIHSENRLDGFDDAYNDKYIDVNYYDKNTLEHDIAYNHGFEADSKKCQDQSYDMCLTDNFNFL
jgi:hypothetical protein